MKMEKNFKPKLANSVPKNVNFKKHFKPTLVQRFPRIKVNNSLALHSLLFISFSSLSYDRSKASSSASSPYKAIQTFLLQITVSSPFLKVIQQLPMSSSSPSCHFYKPFYLSFNNPLQKAVSTQNMTNLVSPPFTYFMQDIPLLLDSQ